MEEEKTTEDILKEEESLEEDGVEVSKEPVKDKKSNGNNDWDSDIEEEEDF